MKDGSISPPKVYLGANIKEWSLQDENGKLSRCWAQSSETYTKESVRVVEALMQKHNLEYTASRRHGTKTPFSTSEYKPDLEATHYCDADLHTIYLNLMGMLRWMIELGRVDILHEASLLSQYMALSRL